MSNKELWEGFVSAAQRKAVWASKADGGKGHPDNKKKKSKKEDVNEISKGMTGKAKVPATESVEVSEKHVYRFSTKTKQGNIHHSSKDDAGAKKAIEKKTGEKVQSMTYRGPASGMPTRREDSDAVKAFLAKGGKIKKLPPAKAQGYHGKDDPGKDVAGVMDKPDTDKFKTRKKVKSMENKVHEDPEMAKMIAKNNAAQQAKRDAANPAAAAKRKAAQANIAKRKPVTPDSIGRHSSQGGGFIGTRESALKTFDDLRSQLSESMLGHSDAEKLNGGKSKDDKHKSAASHIDYHHRQSGGHNKSGGDQDRHRYNVAKKLGYNV